MERLARGTSEVVNLGQSNGCLRKGTKARLSVPGCALTGPVLWTSAVLGERLVL